MQRIFHYPFVLIGLAPLCSRATAQSARLPPQRKCRQESKVGRVPYLRHTELQLRNNLISESLVVTPTLRVADGTETTLNAVSLLPGEVQSIDLNESLAAVSSNLAGRANAYGSIVLRYNSKGLRNLYASVMVHDTGHPIMYHLDAVGQASKYVVGSREGIWWLPTKSTRDFLIVTNLADHPLQGTLWLFDGAGKPWTQPLALSSKQTQRISVRQLVAKAGFSGQYGGIKVEISNGAGSLDTAHIIYDELAGFSATLKMFDYDPRSKVEERDFAARGLWTTRAPMLALSHPDPVLAFPPNTILQPMLLLRNTTEKTLVTNLSFHWRNSSNDGRVSFPALTLAPFETRKIDIQDAQNRGVIPLDAYWAQVSLSTNSLPGEIMVIAASYDAKLRYGAQTPFSDQLIGHLEGGQWQVDANHTSLIAAGNGGDKPAKAALTLFYDQGRKHYQLERAIGSDDQWWVDIGHLIRDQVPDKDGNVLPATLSSGAYQIKEISEPRQDLLYEGKVVTDKTFGHATYGCMICCGYTGEGIGSAPFLVEDPTEVGESQSAWVSVYGGNACTGNPDEISYYFPTWSTWNTSVMTAVPSNVTGVASGSTVIQANATSMPIGDGEGTHEGCPLGPAQSQGGGNVGIPDHLSVVSDATAPIDCPNGSSRIRAVNYNVLDINQVLILRQISVFETVSPNLTSSCTNSSPSVTFSCTPTPAYGNFTDVLSPGCPATAELAESCGYAIPDQTWKWCPPTGISVNLGDIGLDLIYNNSISLGGNSTGFAPGTTFPH